MRKLIVVLLAAGISAFGFARGNQNAGDDPFVLDHLSIGVGAGLDGISADIALPFSRNIIFRAGYGTFSPLKNIGYSRSFRVDTDSPWTIHDNISATIRPTMENFHLLLDYYPTRNGAFHFTVGGYFLQNGNAILHASTDQPLPIPSNEYAVTGVEIAQDGKTNYVTTDEKGYLHADATCGIGRIAPYAGLGFGRAVSDGRVSFLFDLGVLYTDKYSVRSYDYGIKGSTENPIPVELSPSLLQGYDDGLVEKIEKFALYPVLKFSLFFKLF